MGVNTLFVVLLHTFLEFLQCAHAPSLHLFHFVEHIVEVLARAGRLTSLCNYCLVFFVLEHLGVFVSQVAQKLSQDARYLRDKQLCKESESVVFKSVHANLMHFHFCLIVALYFALTILSEP